MFANAAGELLAHSRGYAVVRYRPGAANLDALAALTTEVGALLLQRGWTFLLSNTTELPLLSQAAKDWSRHNWLEGRLPRPSRLHTVTVQPADVLARLSVAEVHSHAQGLIRYTRLPDEAAAHAFIAAQLA